MDRMLLDKVDTGPFFQAHHVQMERANAYLKISDKAHAKFIEWQDRLARYDIAADTLNEPWTFYTSREACELNMVNAWAAHARCFNRYKQILFQLLTKPLYK